MHEKVDKARLNEVLEAQEVSKGVRFEKVPDPRFIHGKIEYGELRIEAFAI